LKVLPWRSRNGHKFLQAPRIVYEKKKWSQSHRGPRVEEWIQGTKWVEVSLESERRVEGRGSGMNQGRWVRVVGERPKGHGDVHNGGHK